MAIHTFGRWATGFAVLATTLVTGCESNTDDDAFRSITVRFGGRVGNEVFGCDSVFHDVGLSRSTFEPMDFRFYVHDVRLLKGESESAVALTQDGQWQTANVALIDFENASGLCSNGTSPVNDQVVGRVQGSGFDGIRFNVGVPSELNHLDVASAASPLNVSGLFWGWTAGYKFVRVDGKTRGVSEYDIHVGSTGCGPEGSTGVDVSCTNENIAEITLRNFDVTKNVVLADYAALVSSNDVDANAPETASGCMSSTNDPDCDSIFRNLGVSLVDGKPAPATQTFFRTGTAD